MRARLSTDGGARGNPGPAAFAYVLETDDGTVLAAHGEAMGVATNNVAEYRALVAGLEKAAELGLDLDDEAERKLLARVKELGAEKRGLVSEDEFRGLADALESPRKTA